MSPGRALAIAFAVAAFLAVSFGVARWLAQDNRERSAVTDLLRAQARGDARAMLAQLDGCAAVAACSADVQANAAALRRRTVRILRYDSQTARAFGDRSGPTRVAWSGGVDENAVVQCVVIERRGLAVFGSEIVLSAIGRPIKGDTSCPQ